MGRRRYGVPDEARLTITVVNAAGEGRSVAKWAGQKVERFDRIYAELLRLETQAQSVKTIYTGKYDREFTL